MRATVVVPCRNVAETIGRQLRALAVQEGVEDLDVIVVDDGSTDGTVDAAREAGSSLRLTVIRNDCPKNVAAARNLGVRHARSEIVLFCDGDDMVSPGWARSLIRVVEERDVLAAGRIEIARLNEPWMVATRAATQQHGLQAWTDPTYLPHAGGGNLAIRKSTFDLLGGFDEARELQFSEAADLAWRAQLSGVPLVFVQDALLHVRLRSTLSGAFRQAFGWGEGSVALHAKFAPHGLNRPAVVRGLLGWGMLVVRLARVRTRADLAGWLHRAGWKLGRLRGSIEGRTLCL